MANGERSIDDGSEPRSICTRFEDAWKEGRRPDVESYVQRVRAESLDPQLLADLVLIDLEYRWRLQPSGTGTQAEADSLPAKPRLEDYAARFPQLGPVDRLGDDLIADEYRIRHLFGDRPGHGECVGRFGEQVPDLVRMLSQIDDDLARQRLAETVPETFAVADGDAAGVGTRLRYFGDYELLEKIGEGGMGVVYKARQMSLNRVVAVKMIKHGRLASEDLVKRFHGEAEAVAQLDHPGIVPIYEIERHEDQYYFSMRYVEGESLAKKVAEGPLSPGEAARLMQLTAEALACAHAVRTIHRDLKPANILLDANGQPCITDFGLAKRTETDSTLTATGEILGTPSYMPPEQASGKHDEVDVRWDVYALGATLYHLLTGRPPFQADNFLDTLDQVREKEPISPRSLQPKLASDLETICLKCLEKDPKRRYATAEEVAAELQRFQRGEAIMARPITGTERAWRWCKRKPVVACLIAGIAVSLLAGTMVSSYFAVEAARSAQDAIQERNKAKVAEEEARRLAEEYLKQRDLAEERRISQQKATYNLTLSRVAMSMDDAPGQALELLDSSDRCPHELRELTWSFLDRRLSRDHFLLRGHEGPVRSLSLSPDERFLASLGVDERIRVWGMQSGKEKRPIRTGEPLVRPDSRGSYKRIAFSHDEEAVLLAAHSRGISSFDIATERYASRYFRLGNAGHTVFSPDRTLLATCGGRSRVRLWDAESEGFGRSLATRDAAA